MLRITRNLLITTRGSGIRFLSTLSKNWTNDRTVVNSKPLTGAETILKYASVPFAFLGLYRVPVNHKAVTTVYGKFQEVKDEGLRFNLPGGFSWNCVFVGDQTHKLPESKVVDADGNPIIVSAIVNYRISHPEKFIVNIRGNDGYLFNQAEAIVKQIASKYPYEASEKHPHSLKGETDHVGDEMRKSLQSKVDVAGIEIQDVYITDLNYAKEIAQQMLIRQQAEAYIKAKKSITSASVTIVNDIIKASPGLDVATQNKLIVNLLTTLSANTGVSPVLHMD